MTHQNKDSTLRMMGVLGLVSALSGFLIVTAYQVTLPMIERNKAQILETSALEVLPQSVKTKKMKDSTSANEYFIGYSSTGQINGFAFLAQGQGFADMIKVLYGYNPYSEKMIALKVLESKETPGIGDKIFKDSNFVANFKSLDLSLDSVKRQLIHPITVTKHGLKTQPWEIDAITGATISSKAMGKLLVASTKNCIPLAWEILKQQSLKQAEGF